MFVGSNAKKRTGDQQPTSVTKENGVSEMCLFERWKKDCQDKDGCQQVIDNHLSFVVDSLQNADLRQSGIPSISSLVLALSFGTFNFADSRTF